MKETWYMCDVIYLILILAVGRGTWWSMLQHRVVVWRTPRPYGRRD